MKHLECQHQIAFVQWFNLNHKNKLLWHTPNGGYRNAWEGARFKKMGVAAGVPDLFIAEPYGEFHGLFIEMKTDSVSSKLTDNQAKMIKELGDRGYCVVVCNGVDAAIRAVDVYFGGGD